MAEGGRDVALQLLFSSESRNTEEFTTFESRLLTYSELNFISNHMTAISLASAGFILITADSEEVLCPWCSLCIKCFKTRVNAYAVHKAYANETCLFIDRFYTDVSLSTSRLMERDEIDAR